MNRQVSVLYPSAPFWKNQEAFSVILGIIPRIVVASLLAYLTGSFDQTISYNPFRSEERRVGKECTG
jgi:uncharacterized PurR-regulated membrane protein YhhQ (DUF165 family)